MIKFGWLFLILSTAAAFVPHASRRPTFSPSFHRARSVLHAKKQHKNSFDLNELKKRIAETHSPYLGELDTAMEHVLADEFYIVFVQPDTDQQGVHTIEYPPGSGTNVILAFEDAEAARKFAHLLAMQNFENPQPQCMNVADLDHFCHQLGVFAQLIPQGIDVIPPSQNVKQFGHDRTLRDKQEHLDYLLSMFETDIFEEEGALAGVGSWDWIVVVVDGERVYECGWDIGCFKKRSSIE